MCKCTRVWLPGEGTRSRQGAGGLRELMWPDRPGGGRSDAKQEVGWIGRHGRLVVRHGAPALTRALASGAPIVGAGIRLGCPRMTGPRRGRRIDARPCEPLTAEMAPLDWTSPGGGGSTHPRDTTVAPLYSAVASPLGDGPGLRSRRSFTYGPSMRPVERRCCSATNQVRRPTVRFLPKKQFGGHPVVQLPKKVLEPGRNWRQAVEFNSP